MLTDLRLKRAVDSEVWPGPRAIFTTIPDHLQVEPNPLKSTLTDLRLKWGGLLRRLIGSAINFDRSFLSVASRALHSSWKRRCEVLERTSLVNVTRELTEIALVIPSARCRCLL
jgi:hypothetical protein